MTAQENPPPHTNRGVETQISVCIDWISATFKKGVEVRYHEKLSTKKTEFKPFNAYNTAVRYDDGRIELSHSIRKEMGVHIIASGHTLRAMPISPEDYLLALIAAGATVTRVDVALDVKNSTLSVYRARNEVKYGRHKTRSRECPFWDDSQGNRGETQYIGKKSSTVFTRIYNKAKEAKFEGKYTRVETVFQDDKAQHAAQKIIAGVDIRSLIRGHVDFPQWKKWKKVMNDAPLVKIKAEIKDTNTQKWLLNTCAPALAREIHIAGDDDFYFRFVDAVKGKLDELREEFDS